MLAALLSRSRGFYQQVLSPVRDIAGQICSSLVPGGLFSLYRRYIPLLEVMTCRDLLLRRLPQHLTEKDGLKSCPKKLRIAFHESRDVPEALD